MYQEPVTLVSPILSLVIRSWLPCVVLSCPHVSMWLPELFSEPSSLLCVWGMVSVSWHSCLVWVRYHDPDTFVSCVLFSVKAHGLHLCLFACHVLFCLVIAFGGSTWLLLCLYFYVPCASPSNFCKHPLVISLLVNLPHLLYFITLLISFPIYFSCALCPVLVHFFFPF